VLFEIGPDDSPVRRWITGAARVSKQEFTSCPNGHQVPYNALVQNLTERLVFIGPDYTRMDSWQCPNC
jgi:hypothetical protein